MTGRPCKQISSSCWKLTLYIREKPQRFLRSLFYEKGSEDLLRADSSKESEKYARLEFQDEICFRLCFSMKFKMVMGRA